MDILNLCDALAMHAATTVPDAIRDMTDAEEVKTITGAYIKHSTADGYVISDLAAQCGVSRSFLHSVINGSRPLPDTLMRSLSQHTDMTVYELAITRALDSLRD